MGSRDGGYGSGHDEQPDLRNRVTCASCATLRAQLAAAEERARNPRCETCGDTGWYGQNGPGAGGHGDQWQACDQCNTGRAQKPVSRLMDELGSRAESAETALAAARAEIAKLKADHCSECGGDMFTRKDTGAQQCLECGTPFVPLRARPDDGRVERGAIESAAVIGHDWDTLCESNREERREAVRRILAAADGEVK